MLDRAKHVVNQKAGRTSGTGAGRPITPKERPRGEGRTSSKPFSRTRNRGGDAVAIGDTPYDAAAAGKAKTPTIGVLCGGFTEASLRGAGCVDVYPGPAALFARFADTLLAR
jgi:hypothetical protein